MKLFLILFALFFSQAREPAWRVLQMQESEQGALQKRDPGPLLAPTLEIPLSALSGMTFLSESQIPGVLMGSREGEPFFRWILDPEDRVYGNRVQEYLVSQGVSFRKGPKVAVYPTASRSYFFWDPKTVRAYTFKTSTDRVGSHLQDKSWRAGEAFDSVMVSEYLQKISLRWSLVAGDTLSMAAGDFGWTLRDYQWLNSPSKKYIPLFLIFNNEYLSELMKAHNATVEHDFVKEYIVKPYARAYAEFVAETGLMMDSPHSQNILLEIDESGKLSGRFVFRDLVDVFAIEDFHREKNKLPLKQLSDVKSVRGRLLNWFNLFHHVATPSWIRYDESPHSMRSMVEAYYEIFKQEFFRRTSVSLPQFKGKVSYGQRHFSHESILPPNLWKKPGRSGHRCEGAFR